MSESQNISVNDDETEELGSNDGNQGQIDEQLLDSSQMTNEAVRQLTNSQSEFLKRQEGMEELLGKFLERQQGVENLLSQLLQQQKHEIVREVNIIEKSDRKERYKPVEGGESPARLLNTLASDRVATDTTLGNPWLITKNSGTMHSELENRLFMSAPHKTIDHLASVAPSMESRANPVLYSLSSDLNSRPIGRSFVSTFPQQYVQSLEGATHASHGTRSGVLNNKGYEVPDKTRKVLEEERRIFEEERRLFEDERRNFEGTGVRPKRVIYRRNEQEAEGAYGLDYPSLDPWDYPSDEEVTFRNAPRKRDRLESELTSNSRMLDPSKNVRSCSNLEFSVAGDNSNWLDRRNLPMQRAEKPLGHWPIIASEGKYADPDLFTTEDRWAITLASKFSFPIRNEKLSSKIASSNFNMKHDESAGLHLSQSSGVYLPHTLHSFELNRNKAENTSVIYSTPSMFARAAQQSQPCLSSVVHERVKEPIPVISAPDRISWKFLTLAGYCHDNFEGSLTPGLWVKFGVLRSSISVE